MSDLKDDVEALRKRMADKAQDKAKRDARSWTGRAEHDLTAIHKFWFQFVMACHWIWVNLIRPATRWIYWPVPYLWHGYRVLWDKVVYYQDQYQNRMFSKTRAGVFLAATAGFLWYLAVPLLVLLATTVIFFSTVKKETVYLTNSQEIVPEDNTHSVQGCHDLPCTDDNSIYYRIRATNFNETWSIVSGRGIFYPDFVAASVPVSISRCEITTYGLRMKLLVSGFDIYPDLIEAKCTPLQDINPSAPN
jgi:hypothetical protein